METMMLLDVNKFRTEVTTVHEHTGRIGFLRIDHDNYRGFNEIGEYIYEIAKDMNIDKIIIDTNGIGIVMYDVLTTRQQDQMKIVALRGSRILTHLYKHKK